MDLTIAKLAQACGVGVETVRYYQRRGLFPVPRPLGGIRRYGGAEVRRLKFIRTAQGAGFTQIGTDHGLLAAPLPQDAIQIAEAERYDVVIDQHVQCVAHHAPIRFGPQYRRCRATGAGGHQRSGHFFADRPAQPAHL